MLSIVIPAYNEENNILKSIKSIETYFDSKKGKYEIIIVNDGSKDRTEKIVKELKEKDRKIRLINNPGNKGKGYAVKNGVLNSTGDSILLVDADLFMSIAEYEKLKLWFDRGYAFCIGSKKIKGAKIKQAFYRKFMGSFFSFLVSSFFVSNIKDTQCGFKLYEAKAAKEIFLKQKINGFGFDVETLFLAKKRGVRIKEVPISLIQNARDSKVNLIKDSFSMLFDIFKIRLLHR